MSVNDTLFSAVEPVATPIGQVVHTVGLLLGGVVGIALLSFVIRIYFMKRLENKVERIEADITWIKKRLQASDATKNTQQKSTKKRKRSQSESSKV
jgi:hypothetical protein